MDQHRAAYLEEAAELLSELEDTLLELESTPRDEELVARAFRAMHTIKGSGAMFGFDDVAAFTHDLETAFDAVRSGEMLVTPELIELALRGRDHIRALLAGDAEPAAGTALTMSLRRLTGAERPAGGDAPAPPDPDAACDNDGAARHFRVHFRLAPDILQNGTSPVLLLDDLRELGSAAIVASPEDVPPLDEIEPERCYLRWTADVFTDRGEEAIRDVFLFVEDDSEIRIEELAASPAAECTVEEAGATAEADAEPAPTAATGAAAKTAARDDARSSDARSSDARSSDARSSDAPAAQSLRVAAAKLDHFVDLVGELVIAQARLTQVASRLADPTLDGIAEDVERLTAELRDNTLDIRMVPIGTTFTRFRRLVRDLSGDLGKQVELVTEGAETELDKTVIERLNDPLVHLIRNSIDHGVEAPEVRTAAGKPARGTVRLTASHSGPNVIIRVADDGAGLDAAVIRRKAEERGLVQPEDDLSESEIFGLIFAAGFSTAAQVSNVSGRGVGMDVVKRSIEALRGSVEVTSRRGVGTTVTVRLPLTLAIIEGLLVQVGGDSFVLPLAIVEECVELAEAQVGKADGCDLANIRGQLVPYVSLRRWFGIDAPRPETEHIAIVNLDGTRFGFVVDHVVGQYQTVLKSLGKFYGDLQGFSGATILGDGAVALILDVEDLIAGAIDAAETRNGRGGLPFGGDAAPRPPIHRPSTMMH